MNWILFVTCLTATLALSCAKYCETAEDCNAGECCLAPTVLKLQYKGICWKLTRKGGICSEPEAKLDYYGGKFLSSCPCVDGFSCEPSKLKEGSNRFKYLASLRCQKPASTPAPDTNVPEVATEDEGNNGDENGNGGDESGNGGDESGNGGNENGNGGDEIGNGGDENGNGGDGTENGGDENGNGDDESGNAGDDETVNGGDETVGEDTGDDVMGDDEIPDDVQAGPGGEPPRDDDCEDWIYPC